MDCNGIDDRTTEKLLLVGTNLATSAVDASGERDSNRSKDSDVAAGRPSSSRPSKSTQDVRQHSYDENDASVSSNDGDDENADVTSLNESLSRFPLTTAEGQLAQNPNYTLPMATLAAKREYNRQNAARARKRAKTLLHTYQEQIQVLTTQLAQLREQNKSLLTTLQSLREENMIIHQSQQATGVMNQARMSNISAQLPTTAHAAGNGALPSTMESNDAGINAATVSNSVTLSSVQNQTIQNLLALLYWTGASIQQSSSTAQHPTSSLPQQYQPIAPDPQPQWFHNQNSQQNVVQQQILPLMPSGSCIGNPTHIAPSNYDAASYLSRILTQPGTIDLNHRSHLDSSSYIPMASTTSSTDNAKVGVEKNHNKIDTKHSNPFGGTGDT